MRAMSGEGGITSALMEQMRSKIQDSLDAQRVEVADVQGDGRHVEIVVVSKEFEGKSAVNRQRLVYKVGCQCWCHQAGNLGYALITICTHNAGNLGGTPKYRARSRCDGDANA